MAEQLKYKDITEKDYRKAKSVKSINQCQSVIQIMYDIVKAHGGEIKMKTREGEGTEFVIQLPLVH